MIGRGRSRAGELRGPRAGDLAGLAAAAAIALALAVIPALAAEPPPPPPGFLSGGPKPELKPGPGSGYRTPSAPMIRPLRPDVRVTAILSSGDTLVAADPDEEPFTFAGQPDGVAAVPQGPGVIQVFVTHEIGARGGGIGARVSRLNLDARSLGVLSADYLLDGSEGYSLLCAATLADASAGFLTPQFLVNEESDTSPRGGVVAAIDTRSGAARDLPWLGRFAHETTLIVPLTTNRIAAVLTEDGPPGLSQLYLYLADNDSDFLNGRGTLHVFRAEGLRGDFASPRLASSASKSRPLSGRFVPIPGADAVSAPELEWKAQRAGAMSFVRLEDAAVDRRQANAFYFADTGDPSAIDPVAGRPVTSSGRVYRMALDPFDPTRVEELRVVLDGDEGDDLFRPDNLETDERCLMIQEDPDARGLRPARILRYDLDGGRLEAIAECAERDREDRPLPKGVGGEWESTGIVNVAPMLGEDSWLLAVQAHTLRVPQFGRLGQAGQLLLLRGPRFPRRDAAPPAR